MSAYPEPVLQQAYAWRRDHPLAADGLLGLVLLACSAGQLRISPAAALGAVTVNVLLALAVALRRQEVTAAFGLAAAIGIAQAVLGFAPDGQPPVRALQPTVTDAAIVVLLYTLAAYRPRRVSLAGLALCLAGSAIVLYRWAPAQHSLSIQLLASAALGATLVATWVLGDSVAYRRAYYVSLEERLTAAERARDLEEKRARAVEESAARLRRIERDLHDGAQVRLTALAMTLGEVKEMLAGPGAGAGAGSGVGAGAGPETLALVGKAHQAAKDTLAELRELARGIHPPVLDRGLDAALRALAETSAIPVTLDIGTGGRPSPAIEAIVYFTTAELLANAAKHSGASMIAVTVKDLDQGILLSVTDNGTGGAHVTDGGGLAGLLGRALTVDGRLDVDSPAGGPTTITIELPRHA
jgi:signal transduction histidine kinase